MGKQKLSCYAVRDDWATCGLQTTHIIGNIDSRYDSVKWSHVHTEWCILLLGTSQQVGQWVSAHVYTHTHAHRQTDWRTDTHTHTHTHTQTHTNTHTTTQTHTQTHKHTHLQTDRHAYNHTHTHSAQQCSQKTYRKAGHQFHTNIFLTRLVGLPCLSNCRLGCVDMTIKKDESLMRCAEPFYHHTALLRPTQVIAS